MPVLEQLRSGLFLYNGPRLLARSRASLAFNRASLRVRFAHVRRVAQHLGFESPILWVFDPLLAHNVGTFREKLVVYHVVDNYVEYFPAEDVVRRAAVERGEAAMLQRADVVFAVSEALHRRCLPRNPNSHLIPNGVDYDRFHASLARTWLASDVASVPRPIIGYVGVIQTTMDFPLLRQLADARRDWSFVLVGPAELGSRKAEFDKLLTRPNVYYLGPKPVEDVPYYIKCCDVCVMPDDERAEGDAIKLYEYLACGRPVVSKESPSVRRFVPLVQEAASALDFEQCIERALAEEPGLAGTRVAVAREHTWQRRVEAIGDAIRRSLTEKASASPSREAMALRGV